MSDQKVALVTGGNRGIGLGIVEGLVREGFQVIMGSRNLDTGRLAIDFLEELSEKVDLMQLDVTDLTNIKKAAKYVRKNYKCLDVLVNNAGIIGDNKLTLKETAIEEVQFVMDTNFYGPMRMSATFLPLLRLSRDPRIINISSSMGALDNLSGESAAYRLSKAGLNAQTILLSNDLKNDGIKVYAVSPGWVRTEMGGAEAHRSVEQGADTAIWLSSADDAETGNFYRDRNVIPW